CFDLLLGTKINSLDNEMGWNITVDGSKNNLLINVSADKKEEIYKGSLKPFKGWQSLFYGTKNPTSQLVITCRNNQNTRFITILTKKNYINIKIDERYIQIDKTYVKLISIDEKYIFDIR